MKKFTETQVAELLEKQKLELEEKFKNEFFRQETNRRLDNLEKNLECKKEDAELKNRVNTIEETLRNIEADVMRQEDILAEIYSFCFADDYEPLDSDDKKLIN